MKILDVNPSALYGEGGETITMRTENGCAAANASLTVNDFILVTLQQHEPESWTFTAPGVDLSSDVMTVRLTCAGRSAYGAQYRRNSADASILIEPALAPLPTVRSYAPFDELTNVDSSATVTFSRAMEPETVNPATFHIEGVPGTVSTEDDTTFVFTPDAHLAFHTSYSVVVLAGNDGVMSAEGKPLKTTLRPEGGWADPAQDRWTFSTVAE